MTVKWSFFADEQLADILRYLAVKLSLEDAVRWAHKFHDAVEQLADQPKLGQPVNARIFSQIPLLVERLLEIHVGNYRVVYELVEDDVRILSLTHNRQMVDGDHLVWDR